MGLDRKGTELMLMCGVMLVDFIVVIVFPTGHGFQVLVDLIRFFSVTHVVQLSYGDTPQCHTITPEFLRSAHGWHTHPPTQSALAEEPANQLAVRSHVLLSIHSEFEGAGTSGEM